MNSETVRSCVADNNKINDCSKFNEQKWCNCHNSFNLTIGVSEGKAILYKDLNNNYNVAGNAINMAARVMGIADSNQIIFTDEAYHQLIDMVDIPTLDESFIEYTGVKIKHGMKISIFQYIGKDVQGLNVSQNEDLELKQKMKNIMSQFGDMGFPLPKILNDDNENEEDKLREKAIMMMEKLSTVLKEGNPVGDLMLEMKNKERKV